MILVNDLSVNLAAKLSKYYDFITEDGDTFAELKRDDISSIKADNISHDKKIINRRKEKWQLKKELRKTQRLERILM